MEKKNNTSTKLPFSRDFPSFFSAPKTPFKYPSSLHHFHRDYPPGCGPNASKLLFQNTDPSLTLSRLLAATSNTPATTTNNNNNAGLPQNPQILSPIDRPIDDERQKVLRILNIFRNKCTEISNSGKGIKRVDMTAYNELKNGGKLSTFSNSKIGEVPGVEIGDKFHYRVELAIVGLHKHFERGIDSVEYKGGRIATCIVASERHLDKMSDPNRLTYIGEGGVLKRNQCGVPPDQELKAGNKALWSSMKEKVPVRVVRGLMMGSKVLYVYDGVYDVVECVKKKGVNGNMIFEFKMVRCGGQGAVNWTKCRLYRF